ASVGGLATDVVAGVNAGAVNVIAHSLGLTDSSALSFTVVHGAPDHVAISGATTDLVSGATRTLTATIQDAANNTVTDSTAPVTFTEPGTDAGSLGLATPSATVAGVATDVVPRVHAGAVNVFAHSLGLTDSDALSFTVVHGAPDHVAISGATTDLVSGATRTLTATIEDAANNTVTDSTAPVTFTEPGTDAGSLGLATPSATVAGVATDVVTGVNAGAVNVFAHSTGLTDSAALSFTVVHGAPDHVAISGATTDLVSGATRTVTATIQDAANNTVTDSTAPVTFTEPGTDAGSRGLAAPTATFAGLATDVVTGVNAGAVNVFAHSLGLTDSSALSFAVVHGAPDHVAI